MFYSIIILIAHLPEERSRYIEPIQMRLVNNVLRRVHIYSGLARGEPGGHGLSIPEIRMVESGGPGCLIHKVAKYRGHKDACVRISFPVIYPKKFVVIQI